MEPVSVLMKALFFIFIFFDEGFNALFKLFNLLTFHLHSLPLCSALSLNTLHALSLYSILYEP